MKVFVQPQAGLSRAMDRVAEALAKYAPPGVEVVTEREDADLVVLHVIGAPETVKAIEELKAQGKRYSMMQYCVRSTQERSTAFWLPLWQGAACVWSYYDLDALAVEDGVAVSDRGLQGVNFYHAPLGVDGDVFQPVTGAQKRFTICTSGYVPETEGVLEAMAAAKAVGGSVFHLGPHDGRYGSHVTTAVGISDAKLVQRYSESTFVAGLRRAEGFELPAAEGLLCGARPIMFDVPHYRKWFEPWALFVPEADFDTVRDAMAVAFREGAALPVHVTERRAAAERFHWPTLVAGFWERIVPKVQAPAPREIPRVQGPKPVLLVIGDAGVPTGFGKVTHAILDVLYPTWDVHVVGINYIGDRHTYPYTIYPPSVGGGDGLGVTYVEHLLKDSLAPDAALVINDPWYMPRYLRALGTVPTIASMPVDGLNCQGAKFMSGLRGAIFWTEASRDEARRGGYTGPAFVIPLGVDLETYSPMDQAEARDRLGLARWCERRGLPPDTFIVGVVGRNQTRKRFDLAIRYFAQWIHTRGVKDAVLYMHSAPTGDDAFDLPQLARYYGIQSRFVEPTIKPRIGVTDSSMRTTFSALSALLFTSQNEGWALPAIEAMACGTVCVVPRWPTCEWLHAAALTVPCTMTSCTEKANVIGVVPDMLDTVNALDTLYHSETVRREYRNRGLALVQRPEYRWPRIGAAYGDALASLLQHQMRTAELVS